jgi:hypothetical protein
MKVGVDRLTKLATSILIGTSHYHEGIYELEQQPSIATLFMCCQVLLKHVSPHIQGTVIRLTMYKKIIA